MVELGLRDVSVVEPRVAIRRSSNVPLLAEAVMNAFVDPAVSVSRIITPAFADALVF